MFPSCSRNGSGWDYPNCVQTDKVSAQQFSLIAGNGILNIPEKSTRRQPSVSSLFTHRYREATAASQARFIREPPECMRACNGAFSPFCLQICSTPDFQTESDNASVIGCRMQVIPGNGTGLRGSVIALHHAAAREVRALRKRQAEKRAEESSLLPCWSIGIFRYGWRAHHAF